MINVCLQGYIFHIENNCISTTFINNHLIPINTHSSRDVVLTLKEREQG